MILMHRVRPRKTVEDFMSLPEGTRAELIDGEILMSPSPRPLHQLVAGKLFRLLADYVEQHSLGLVFVAPCDVHLPSEDIVQPDVLFVSTNSAGIVQDWVRGAPDLVIEVLSPENPERDLLVKRGLYAKNGVPEYWILNPEDRSLEVFILRGLEYEAAAYFNNDDVLASPVLPGFKPKIADVFNIPGLSRPSER